MFLHLPMDGTWRNLTRNFWTLEVQGSGGHPLLQKLVVRSPSKQVHGLLPAELPPPLRNQEHFQLLPRPREMKTGSLVAGTLLLPRPKVSDARSLLTVPKLSHVPTACHQFGRLGRGIVAHCPWSYGCFIFNAM